MDICSFLKILSFLLCHFNVLVNYLHYNSSELYDIDDIYLFVQHLASFFKKPVLLRPTKIFKQFYLHLMQSLHQAINFTDVKSFFAI